MLGRFLGIVNKLRIEYLANSPEHAMALGLTKINLLRAEKLVLEQAEVEAEQIRSGLKTVGDFEVTVHFKEASPAPVGRRSEPTLGISQLAVAVTSAMVEDRLTADVNVAKAAIHAAADLAGHQGELPNEEVDDDWLRAWRKGAEGISSDELQSLWGKLLSGKIKSPKQYSLRTLRFLETLSTDEAKEIAEILSFAFDGSFIYKSRVLDALGWNFGRLLKLEELGLLSGVTGPLSWTLQSVVPDRMLVFKRCHDVMLHIESGPADRLSEYKFPGYTLTGVGRDLSQLGKFRAISSYINDVVEQTSRKGLSVRILPWQTDPVSPPPE